jgi:hypothetical protein
VPSTSPSGTGEKMPPKERAIAFPDPSDPGMLPGPALVVVEDHYAPGEAKAPQTFLRKNTLIKFL